MDYPDKEVEKEFAKDERNGYKIEDISQEELIARGLGDMECKCPRSKNLFE